MTDTATTEMDRPAAVEREHLDVLVAAPGLSAIHPADHLDTT